MLYNHTEIEKNWQKKWKEDHTYKVTEDPTKEKYYILDMFPYPSGAGLHVGHPLGYISSDIFARYKRAKGLNVLHPMGYDSFGLPAEQYAIQTGQHPAITTETNVKRYREQLDKIGFSFDWDREVRTSSPKYYKWTQWIFKQIFDSWYNKSTNKAEKIDSLVAVFEKDGNTNVNACCEETKSFSAKEWNAFSEKEQNDVLMNYRLAFLSDSWVNWCPALGTVLANDEIKNGVSERGGHPVEQKLMRQWSMRITAYAERLLQGLDTIDWSEALKEQQRNWIGKSKGASVKFFLSNENSNTTKEGKYIEVFTTRPDTIFGVNFMVLAPEHELVTEITTEEYREKVGEYIKQASLKTERDRQSEVKNITGEFTGAYAIHPFTGEKIAIWIGDYVLASYGTGAVMAVPAGDQRDWDFASHFGIEKINIFEGVDISEKACEDKEAILCNSDFLNGLSAKKAIGEAIKAIQDQGYGKGKTNYRLRDAIFSRQRYWGEPFPVYFENGIPKTIEDEFLPIELPKVDKYLPTETGEPPLGNAQVWSWCKNKKILKDNTLQNGSCTWGMELNTMPGWAGSSWYFLRYMDPNNEKEFASPEKIKYWNQVDLYVGGSEHATGHLLYSRFWTKFLFDMGYINFEEPFKKLINQGMILGTSQKVYKLGGIKYNSIYNNKQNSEIAERKQNYVEYFSNEKTLNKIIFDDKKSREIYYSSDLIEKNPDYEINFNFQIIRIDVNYVNNNVVSISDFTKTPTINKEFAIITSEGYYLEDGFYPFENIEQKGNNQFISFSEVEKMSKTYYNVQTPDELVEKYGADTLRCYEMFLGPIEQAKPWDTKGISGVNNFLKKLWRLFYNEEQFLVTEGVPTKQELKILHKTIKKVTEDIERFSLNTVVSTLMIAVNELQDIKCHNKIILENLLILLSPYAPHIAEELWNKLGHSTSITTAKWPDFDERNLVEDAFAYPVSFNGKMRFKIELPTNLSKEDIEKEVLAAENSQKWLEGKPPKKIIVVPNKIVNIVV